MRRASPSKYFNTSVTTETTLGFTVEITINANRESNIRLAGLFFLLASIYSCSNVVAWYSSWNSS